MQVSKDDEVERIKSVGEGSFKVMNVGASNAVFKGERHVEYGSVFALLMLDVSVLHVMESHNIDVTE